MKTDQHLLPLKGVVQHYAWGGYAYIPNLIRQENPDLEPFAELWMGTHDRGPAVLKSQAGAILLKDWLSQTPEALGASQARFGAELPFLFKVLDVREMLSIQSHPTKAQAIKGFAAENEAGVPLSAPHRNFKDDNHKPEVMVALTDFWLLHGFRPEPEINAVLQSEPAFAPLIEHFKAGGIYGLYKTIMEWPQAQIDEVLHPLRERVLPAKLTDKSSPDFWAKRAFEQYSGTQEANYDRGIFSIYLFNLVYIPPGKGIFQGAGIPHAYLEGVNVELMANSDNVFRGGLTVKHVDVPMLLSHLNFDAVVPNILEGEPVNGFEFRYPTPAEDFQLNRIQLQEGDEYQPEPPKTAAIALVLEGVVRSDRGRVFRKGEAFFLPAGITYTLTAEEDATLFKALVPVD
ncbi:MAG: mannose-6-phosphate isomerase, class I [Phaeodactylibacter sp.]|uniref:mannose-6-phosphate isomerase, class I n=1 Tax=Phaeodactylibacter sp. TaxID=1940289 RepID=UPI0032ED04B4